MGIDVTLAIREPAISAAVSAVATTLGARTELIRRQRELIEKHHRRMVVEGRDITTVVAPDAEVRMLLTASEEARLRRRGIQIGGSQNAEQLAAQVTHRDAKDSTVVNFTTAADGVVTLDSSELDFEETVQSRPRHRGPRDQLPRSPRVTDPQPAVPGRWTTAWSRPVGWILDHVVYRTSVTGRSNVPAAGPVIFAGNHISFLDGPVMFGASPRPMHILVKQEMFTGFLGRVLAGVGPAARGPPRRSCGAGQRPGAYSTPDGASGFFPKVRGGAARPPRSTTAWHGWRSTPVPPWFRWPSWAHESAANIWTRFPHSAGGCMSASAGPSTSAAGPARAAVFQWTGRESKSGPRWPVTSRTRSKEPGSPCPTRNPRTNVMKQ